MKKEVRSISKINAVVFSAPNKTTESGVSSNDCFMMPLMNKVPLPSFFLKAEDRNKNFISKPSRNEQDC